jgi:hypothetical protein
MQLTASKPWSEHAVAASASVKCTVLHQLAAVSAVLTLATPVQAREKQKCIEVQDFTWVNG